MTLQAIAAAAEPRPESTKDAFRLMNDLIAKVHEIKANVPPCKAMPCPNYVSDGAVDGVIELRAGRAAELGLRPGSPARPQPGSTGLGASR